MKPVLSQQSVAANFSHVLLFKTNIQTVEDKNYIKYVFDNHYEIERWHIDLEDCDCVLKIISSRLNVADIIELLNLYGFSCEELI
jgi:ribosome maturation factor RimP